MSNRSINVFNFFCFSIIVFLILRQSIGYRVGDGMEYYSMLFNLASDFVPFGTKESFSLYDNYVNQTENMGFYSSDLLSSAFSIFSNNEGNEIDYPHFWFFSLLAVPFYWVLNLLGLDIGLAFTFVNLLCLIFVLKVAKSNYNSLGVTAAILIIISSPIIWYVNKAHTEFFTVTLMMAAVIYLMKNKLLIASLLFAIIGTQNPPFSILSVLVGGYALFDLKASIFTKKNIVFCLIIFFFLALHPAYYFHRIGVITPQLLNGISNESLTINKAFLFLFDIDIGLFINWPLGLISFVLLPFMLYKYKMEIRKKYLPHSLIILLSCFVFMYSHGKTANLNHGAVVYMSRYALWYLAFFFPIIYMLLKETKKGYSPYLFVFLSVFIFLNITVNSNHQHPRYLFSSRFSDFIYTYFPSIYETEPEVFIEKAIKKEIGVSTYEYWATANDLENKVLVIKRNLSGKKLEDLSLPANAKSNYKEFVYEKANEYFTQNPEEQFVYIYPKKENFVYSPLMINENIDAGKESSSVFFSNFYPPESWGRWMHGSKGSILFSLHNENIKGEYLELQLSIHPFLYKGIEHQDIKISMNDEIIHKMKLSKSEDLKLNLKKDLLKIGNNELSLSVNSEARPIDVGINTDLRLLGLGLSGFKVSTNIASQ